MKIACRICAINEYTSECVAKLNKNFEISKECSEEHMKYCQINAVMIGDLCVEHYNNKKLCVVCKNEHHNSLMGKCDACIFGKEYVTNRDKEVQLWNTQK